MLTSSRKIFLRRKLNLSTQIRHLRHTTISLHFNCNFLAKLEDFAKHFYFLPLLCPFRKWVHTYLILSLINVWYFNIILVNKIFHLYLIWIQNFFTLNLRFGKWYEFFFPGNDILLVKSASQPSTSIRWWILITKTPEKKSPESAFIIFLLSAFVKIMQQKTYVIFWCEKMILASNLLNSTYFVTWFLQKQKKRDEKSWTITLDFFWDFFASD